MNYNNLIKRSSSSNINSYSLFDYPEDVRTICSFRTRFIGENLGFYEVLPLLFRFLKLLNCSIYYNIYILFLMVKYCIIISWYFCLQSKPFPILYANPKS